MGKLKDAYTAVASAVKQQVSSLFNGGGSSSSSSAKQTISSGQAKSTSSRTSSGSAGKTSSGTKSSSKTSGSSQAATAASNGTRRSNNEYQKQKDKKNQGKSSTGGKKKNQKQSIYSSNDGNGKKSQGGSEDNYLAETVEESIANQPQKIYSGGEEAKKPDQQGQDQQQIYSGWQQVGELEEPNYKPDDGKMDVDPFAAWEAGQAKQQANLNAAKAADTEVERLRREGQNKSQIWEDGIYVGEDRAVADEYSQLIAAAQAKADAAWKAAGGKKESDKSLDEKLGEKSIAERLRENNEAVNEQLGNPDAWGFLAENQQVNDQASGWGNQYGGGVLMSVGTGLQWFDKASDEMVRAEYDAEHGEGAYDRAIAGKNVNQVGQLGESIWNTGVGMQQKGEEDWARGTEDLSDTGKFIANVAKTGTDVAADAALNGITFGLGTLRMYAGAAGNAAYQQSQKENSDTDSRMLAAVKGAASAYLSTKLTGGLEGVYGKSVLGEVTRGALKNTSPEVQQVLGVLLNSEGVEEGVEDILNWAGDRILGLDTGTPLDWNEVKQDALVGYILGVVTNGLAGGMNIDSAKRQAIANEAVEFAESGLSIDEAAEIGKQNTRDQVVMKPGAHEAGANVETEAETRTETPAAEAPQQGGLNGILNNPQGKNGQLSNSQVAQILQNPDMYQEFLAAAGLQDSDIDHSSKSAERADIRDAANRIRQQRNNQEVTDIINEWNEQQGAITETPTEPNADTTRRVQEIRKQADAEQRNLAPGEINQILNDPAALKAYADQTGTTVRQARAELEQLLNGGTDVGTETETAPEQPRVDDTERTPTNRFWNAVNEGPDALLHLIAEDPANMEEYMRIFQEATGEQMSNDPDVLLDQISRITDEAAERSGKKQLQADLEAAEAELDDALREYNETGEWTPELDDLANQVDSLRDQLGMEPKEYFSENGENSGNNNAGTEQNASGNEDTRQNRGNQNQRQNAGNQQQNGGQEQNGPGYQDSATTGSGKEKVSEHFTNTLTGREGEDVRSPITYLTKSDAETLQNAMNRLDLNREAETQTLMATTMWTDEQVKMGKAIGNELLNDARQSGDYTAYDAWRMVESEHARAIARALRAEAEAGADQTERTRSLSNRYLDLLESAQQDPNNKGPKVDQETIDKARQTVNDVATEISRLESAEADYVRQGYSEEEAFDMVKDDYLDLAQRLVAERNMGLITDNILGKNAAIRKGNNDVQTKLRKMLAKEDPEYIRQYCRANNSGVATDVVYKSRPTLKQAATMISSLQSMCMLFGTGTFLRNTESNVVFGALNNVSNNTFGVAADALISVVTGQRTRGMGVGVLRKSGWEAFGSAGRRSVLEIAANMDMREDGKYIGSTQAFSPYNPVTRVFARLNQILSYSLNTSDAVIVGMTADTAGNAAYRVGEKSGMTEKTAEKIGEQEADYATFKNNTAVTKFLEGVQNFFDLAGFGGELVKFNGTNIVRGRKGGFGLGTLLAKFVKVPANIKTKGPEFSPIGVGMGVVNAVEAAKMAKNSSPNSQARQDSMVLQNKASGQIGRGMTGTAFIFGLAMLIKAAKASGREWFKDWDQENNKNIKAQNKSEGKSGQQINLSALGLAEGEGDFGTGDRAVDISSNEPLNQLLTMAAALADDEDMLSFEDYADALKTGITENIADMPCVETFSTFQQNMEYSKVYETTYEEDAEGNIVENREEKTGATFLNALGAAAGSAVSGFVPGTLRRAASIQDEYKRDTRGKNAAETAWNQVVNSIPTFEINGKTYGRGSLPVKTDAFGSPVSQGDMGTRVANAFLANRYSDISQGKASQEINRLYEETGTSLMPSSTAPRTMTFGSGKNKHTVELDMDEGRAYQKERGKEYEKGINKITDNAVYQNVGIGTQEAIMKKEDAYTKANAKEDLAKAHHVSYENPYEGISKLNDPTGYLLVNTTFNKEKKNGNYDVIDMLIPQIGKMSEKDQAYLRDKNSSAMMYYDYLTPNAYGYKADSAKAVGYMKEQEKANAEARGVTQASGQDTMKAITKGYKFGMLTDNDVKAMMTKQASNGYFDVTKGRAAVFLAAIAGGKSVETALNLANSADLDKDGTIDEKGLYIKPEREGTKVLKNAGINKAGQKAFDKIMYPNGRGKRNHW